jgi:hypothetical protein
MHILLDDQDCAPLLGDMAADTDQILHDQWRESLERLVEQDEPRFAHEGARAIASICCSPPERSRPRLLRRSARRGNIS